MKKNISYELAESAFTKKEMVDFFLGNPPYNYKPKNSPAPGNTDLSELIPDGIFPYLANNAKTENIDYLNNTLIELCNFPEGMYSVACFILLYNSYVERFDILQKININNISALLKSSINEHKSDIFRSNSILGRASNAGLYGVLKTLSKNTEELGGHSFFPEDGNQDYGVKI